MFIKKAIALALSLSLTGVLLAGCQSGTPSAGSGSQASTGTVDGEVVHIKLFTGKIETIDVMNEIIEDFNASQDRIVVEQEYQKDASNVIKIKFASNEVPDIMTTYEQGFVDEGKYMDLTDLNEFWDRMSPEMKLACTDVNQGKAFRVCTNMTMAGFFYNKEIFDSLGLTPATNWADFVGNLEAIKAAYPEVDPWFIFGSEAWSLGHLIEFIPHGYLKAKYGALETKKAMLANDKEILAFADPDGAMATFARGLLEVQEKGLVNSDVLTATSDNCIEAFVNGETAMFSNGMWCLSSILAKDPSMADKIGFAPYPSMMDDGVPVVLVAEDSGYSISASSVNQQQAIEFLDYLFTPENQKRYSEALGSPSAFIDVDAAWAPQSVVDGVDEAVASAANIGYTNEKPAGFTGDDAGRMVQDLLAGRYTAEEFAKAYETAWDAGF